MTWWIKNFKWKNWISTFKDRKEDINKKGRPLKWIWAINQQLSELWYTPASKNEIETCYMSMLQLSQEELLKMWNDKDKPMLIRILSKNMLWWKGFDIIEKMLDRGIWKAVAPISNPDGSNINPINMYTINIPLNWREGEVKE
jgi:hypothetical protein